MSRRPRRRNVGLRTLDDHASWREVYLQMDVDTRIQEVIE